MAKPVHHGVRSWHLVAGFTVFAVAAVLFNLAPPSKTAPGGVAAQSKPTATPPLSTPPRPARGNLSLSCDMGVGVWCSGVPESAHCGHLTDKCANLPESVVAQPGAISGWHAAQANTRRRVEADLTATTGPAPASQRTLAIIGDSITEALAGYRVGHYHRGYYSKPFPGKLTEYWRPKNISVLPWGIAADRTEQVLWRLTHHELAGVPQAPPSAVMLWIGTNNLARGHTPSETVAGIKAIVAILLQLFPGTPLLLMSLLPRADCKLLPPAARCTLGEMGNVINNEVIKVNALMQEYAASVDATYVDCYSTFADPLTTRLPKDLFPDLLHPNLKGYQTMWDKCLFPFLKSHPSVADRFG